MQTSNDRPTEYMISHGQALWDDIIRGDMIADCWHIDDLQYLDDTLTDDEARAILQQAWAERDAGVGFNWHIMEEHIERFRREQHNESRQ